MNQVNREIAADGVGTAGNYAWILVVILIAIALTFSRFGYCGVGGFPGAGGYPGAPGNGAWIWVGLAILLLFFVIGRRGNTNVVNVQTEDTETPVCVEQSEPC